MTLLGTKVKYYLKSLLNIKNDMKKHSFWKLQVIFWIIITSFTFLSCNDEENSIENEIFAYLQGEWVTTHMSEEEHFMPNDGQFPVDYSTDKDITSVDDEDYAVISFDKNSMCTLLASGSQDDMSELPVSARFRLDGDKLSCPLFYGDFTKYVTITIKSDNEMVMTLIDNGTDESGTTLYTQITTFKRYK